MSSFVYDHNEAARALNASRKAVMEARDRGCSDSLKYRISQRAAIAAMKRHGRECLSDTGFIAEQVEYYGDAICVDPRLKIKQGAMADKVWGKRRVKSTASRMHEFFEAAKTGEKLRLNIVIR
jgi:hypothetical protein